MASMKDSVDIILPNQLFENSNLTENNNQKFLIEEEMFFDQYKFHKQKLLFHRMSMKNYEKYLVSKGFKVTYIESKDSLSKIIKLISFISEKFKKIEIIDPEDYLIERRIKKECNICNIFLKFHDNKLFLNNKSELSSFFNPAKKKFFQTSFYKLQRKKLNILVDANFNPEGGDWTYDVMNREKYPSKKTPPTIAKIYNDKKLEIESKNYIENKFSNNPGDISSSFKYPTDFEISKLWFNDFLENRFEEFGPYEDSIVQEEVYLNHSIISPLLNSGLLDVKYVLEKTLEFYERKKIPINSCEGFIRQIIGWREFIRGVYYAKGNEERKRNFWDFNRKIPMSFYNGTTGILPVDDTIKKIIKTGYAHHIERLMIIGNFMLLCEFDPDEVYRWFMELFIDSYDWVMVPNVYGMSQFADGGLMSTKPYISGSNYIIKMSNYKKGEWSDIWDSLFWNFIDKKRSFFEKNPRMRLLIRNFDKMAPEKKIDKIKIAENYLETLI
tara:strand:- start:518 stop:2011 length:1494 start_codon:yes stop_codon:yes gene_type:complete